MSQDIVYRIIQRATKAGTWDVIVIAGKKRLFRLSFEKESSASWLTSNLVDEFRNNRNRTAWDVQDENGRSVKDATKRVS